MSAAVEEAKRASAGPLVVDALSSWAGFGADQEEDAGAAQAAMNALMTATRAGLAVLLVHHQRKAGGQDDDAVRGSSAIFGAVDLLLELEHCGDSAPAGQRRLVATGRWRSTPPVLVIDRDAELGAWRVVGEVANREEAGAPCLARAPAARGADRRVGRDDGRARRTARRQQEEMAWRR